MNTIQSDKAINFQQHFNKNVFVSNLETDRLSDFFYKLTMASITVSSPIIPFKSTDRDKFEAFTKIDSR